MRFRELMTFKLLFSMPGPSANHGEVGFFAIDEHWRSTGARDREKTWRWMTSLISSGYETPRYPKMMSAGESQVFVSRTDPRVRAMLRASDDRATGGKGNMQLTLRQWNAKRGIAKHHSEQHSNEDQRAPFGSAPQKLPWWDRRRCVKRREMVSCRPEWDWTKPR